jgi:serine/threonine-protein kinase
MPDIAIPGYSIVKWITDGGSASIFKAKKHPYDKLVALKVLLPQHVENKDMLRGFYREVSVLERMKHPNVITSYGWVKVAPRPTIELELFESLTIKQLITKAGGKLDVKTMAHVMKQTIEGLSYIHSLEIAHHDVKPDNILVNEKREVKVIDFSIARELKKSLPGAFVSFLKNRWSSSDTFTIQGTLSYCSPEQIKRDDPGPPADIYALGLVIFECLTGAPPFRSTDQKGLIKAHVSDPAPSMGKARPDAPADLVELVRLMLQKDPKERPDATTIAQILAKHAG